MGYQYRMLRGKAGAAGYLRSDGQKTILRGTGLSPGGRYAAYIWNDGTAQLLAGAEADGNGGLQLSAPGEQRMFLAGAAGVVLWEEGENGAQNFWRAQTAFNAWQKAQAQREKTEKADMAHIEGEEKKPKEKTRLRKHRSTAAKTKRFRRAAPGQRKTPEEEMNALNPASDAALHASLRPESNTPSADALPVLVWPEAAAHLKPYFETQPPFMPFDAPGWRFVRVPSPLRGVAYCAVGVYARDARIEQVAYAVPGTAQRAPAMLPGYRYQMGRSGQGYWTLWQRV